MVGSGRVGRLLQALRATGHSYAIGVVDPDWTAQPLMGILTRVGEQREGLDFA